MYKINFNHLYYFLMIVKEGSIVGASKKLNITQPALSHQLKLLELDLGKKLFDRVGRRLVINENGIKVKEYTSKIFRLSEEMLASLKNDNNEIIKIFKVGVVPWVPKNIISSFLKSVLVHKQIQLHVFEKDLESLVKELQSNVIDIIICDTPYLGRSKKIQSHHINSDEILCVASESIEGKFPLKLRETQLINCSELSQIRNHVDNFLKINNIKPKIIGEFSDVSLILTSLVQKNTIAFLPKQSVIQKLREKKIIKLGTIPNRKFNSWCLTRKDYRKEGFIASLIQRYKK